MRRRLALLAVLVSALASTGTASAAVPSDFFGVVALHNPSASEFQTLGRGKVGTFRLVLGWTNVEPSPGQRLWASYDAQFEQAALNGIRVMPTLYGSPSWAAGKVSAPPSRSARGAWTQFVRDAVARYGAGGTFWQQFALTHPNVPALPVANWQLWNEVNSPFFWTSKPSAKQYGKFVKQTSRVIRAGDRSANVVLAGMFTKPTLKRAIRIEDFLDDLYKVKKIKKFFDAVDVHPYANNPNQVIKAVKLVRAVLKRNKDRKSEVWVGEMGWASSGQPSRFTIGPTLQATYLSTVYRRLMAKAGKFNLAGVIWYSLRDAGGSEEWLYKSGLFDLAGNPKPAWFSLVALTGGSP